MFHTIVAELIWAMQCSQPDLSFGVSFICSRVEKSTIGNLGKLLQVLVFLNNTLHEQMIVSANNLCELYTWVDASYAGHVKTCAVTWE